MSETPTIIQRPGRFDNPFEPEGLGDAQVARLLKVAPFKEMDPNGFPKRTSLADILKHDMRVRTFGKGELIVRAGDYGTSAFMVLSGSVRVVLQPGLPNSVLGRRETRKVGWFRAFAQLWSNSKQPEIRTPSQLKQDSRVAARQAGKEVKVFLQDVPRVLDEHRTSEMQAGEFFGELAALTRSPRSATVFAAAEGTEMLEVRWQGLRDLMRYDESLRKHIEETYRERALATHLREIPCFGHLTPEQLMLVMAETEFATHGDYEWSKGASSARTQETVIASEGDYPNGVVLIRSGFARLSQKFGNGQRTLNYLGAGRDYGFAEIAHNFRNKDNPVTLQHSLSVIGYTHVIVIPTRVMEQVVLPTLPADLIPELTGAPAARGDFEAAAEADAGAHIGPDVMEFLTEHRYFNGSATMLIDLERCTRCDDCVRACASTHDNNPRFLRHGPTNGRIMVANACMHCADPVCMIGCPTGAIHRESFAGQVTINQATCIGCTACANQCPYEAIRMVDVRDGDGNFILDEAMRPIIKATKCDLCVEQYGGPACERACPHSALVRMNMNNLDAFARWLRR
ncbi:MAG: cyclic nucleotide-binding domain-containing protein [Verrucomicrobia bacterium]|nr:cyclic nucleotide-binding domain-containing protein [Verrucomicrobiota bacterium]